MLNYILTSTNLGELIDIKHFKKIKQNMQLVFKFTI